MELKEKADILMREINCSIGYFEYKHKRTKMRAYMIRISSVAFSAFITVLLGLNIYGLGEIFKNIALVLGAFVAIINSVDSFYDYKALWVKNTITLVKLRELKSKVEFSCAGDGINKMDERKLSNFMDQLNRILKDDLREWLRIRAKISSEEEKSNDSIPNEIVSKTIIDKGKLRGEAAEKEGRD